MRPLTSLQFGPKQIKGLILSPQMQKALSLLQLPVMELGAAVTQELEENPILEYSEEENKIENDDLLFEVEARYKIKPEETLPDSIENRLTYEATLSELLMEQAREVFHSKDLKIAEYIIGNLDDSGFLKMETQELSFHLNTDEKKIEKVIQIIQTFDPPGIGARSLKESLLIQLQRLGKKNSLVYNIIANFFEEMSSNKWHQIARENGKSISEIQNIVKNEIEALHFHPGELLKSEKPNHIVPDVFLHIQEGSYTIELNERSIPPFRVNPYYLKLLTQSSLNEDTRHYIKEKIQSGKWFLRSLCERGQSIHKITEQIYLKQQAFFLEQEGSLVQLTMKEVADSLGIHESTVARGVAGKYLSSPKGLHPLRFFFTHAYTTPSGGQISAVNVKEWVGKIIRAEDPKNPLSDEAVSHILESKGIACARRTVAKYRNELGLGPRSGRKRY